MEYDKYSDDELREMLKQMVLRLTEADCEILLRRDSDELCKSA